MLGDLPQGNGDASLCVFGEHITPNHHKVAREFVLLDNTYCSGILSADGHQWTDSAMANDYMERSFAGFPRSYPFGGTDGGVDALAYSSAGFIWDNVDRARQDAARLRRIRHHRGALAGQIQEARARVAGLLPRLRQPDRRDRDLLPPIHRIPAALPRHQHRRLGDCTSPTCSARRSSSKS